MKRFYLPLLTIFSAFSWWLGSTSPAYAYLDPGTVTLLFQAAIGLIASAAVTLGIYWKNAKGFFINLFGRKKTPVKDNSGE